MPKGHKTEIAYRVIATKLNFNSHNFEYFIFPLVYYFKEQNNSNVEILRYLHNIPECSRSTINDFFFFFF